MNLIIIKKEKQHGMYVNDNTGIIKNSVKYNENENKIKQTNHYPNGNIQAISEYNDNGYIFKNTEHYDDVSNNKVKSTKFFDENGPTSQTNYDENGNIKTIDKFTRN
ncbi:DUF2963 domain-containing protein [Candidatus Phytoplasma ziziphi]|nr:DUF2963 domain-containing protein [Candidatus Phytoplasma ziziphi]